MFMLGRVGLVRIADSIPRSRNDLDQPFIVTFDFFFSLIPGRQSISRLEKGMLTC